MVIFPSEQMDDHSPRRETNPCDHGSAWIHGPRRPSEGRKPGQGEWRDPREVTGGIHTGRFEFLSWNMNTIDVI